MCHVFYVMVSNLVWSNYCAVERSRCSCGDISVKYNFYLTGELSQHLLTLFCVYLFRHYKSFCSYIL
jgi:hypothetical protein